MRDPVESSLGRRHSDRDERHHGDRDARVTVAQERRAETQHPDDEQRGRGCGPDALAGKDSGHERSQREEPARAPRQTDTRSRSCSNFAGPMPRTPARSSTLRNGPCSSRSRTIAAAVAGPTPGSASSCSGVAVLRSTGPGAAVAADVGPRCRRQRLALARHRDARAVGEASREIQLLDIGVGGCPAGGGDRVVHACAGRHANHTRGAHCADDVDDDLGLRCAR